jgi:hypothetical protein
MAVEIWRDEDYIAGIEMGATILDVPDMADADGWTLGLVCQFFGISPSAKVWNVSYA